MSTGDANKLLNTGSKSNRWWLYVTIDAVIIRFLCRGVSAPYIIYNVICRHLLHARLTYSFHYILCFLHLETLGHLYDWYGIVFQTICLSAFQAVEVYVVYVVVVLAAAHTVFLYSRAVVYYVKQMMLGKQFQCAEYAGTFCVGHPSLHVGK